MKKYIQIYSGQGKAKTMAVFGLAYNSAFDGKKVFMVQFIKDRPNFDVTSIQKSFPQIVVKQYYSATFAKQKIEPINNSLIELENVIFSAKYDLVIIDELSIALDYKVFAINELIKVIKHRPISTEIVITANYINEELIDVADAITEMKEINFVQSGTKDL